MAYSKDMRFWIVSNIWKPIKRDIPLANSYYFSSSGKVEIVPCGAEEVRLGFYVSRLSALLFQYLGEKPYILIEIAPNRYGSIVTFFFTSTE